MAEFAGMTILQNEIEKAKDKLKDVNDNIKKLTGRDPTDMRSMRGGRQQESGRGRGRLFNLARRGIMPEEGGGGGGGGGGPPPAKRRNMRGAFSRLGPMPARRREREDSGDEDEPPTKLSVQSSVVATSRDARSREDTMAQQSKDREGLQRNRRMFGLLLGTLQKFKTDSKVVDKKAEQRKQIEKKLEEDAEREKKRYHQETQQLIEESQLEQAKISRLQQKMELVNEHETMTNEMKKLHNFICTRAKPRIFWKPKTMNSGAESRLKESKKTVDKMIAEKDQALEREITQVMEREHEREDRVRSRVRHNKENTDTAPPPEGSEDDTAATHNNPDGNTTTQDGGRRRSGGGGEKGGQRHGAHKEAKKKQHEMQYDDGEEEEEGEGEGRTGGRGGGEGADGIKQEGVSPAKAAGVKEEESPSSSSKTDKAQAGGLEDDGNNTDVDYEDDDDDNDDTTTTNNNTNNNSNNNNNNSDGGGEEEEVVVVREEVEVRKESSPDALSAIPMPPEPTAEEGDAGGVVTAVAEEEDNNTPMGPVEPGRGGGGEREVATVRLAQVGGGAEGMDEQELEVMEARRRRAVMAEDGEDMEDEPADE